MMKCAFGDQTYVGADYSIHVSHDCHCIHAYRKQNNNTGYVSSIINKKLCMFKSNKNKT